MKRDEKEEQTEHEGSFYAHVRRTRGKSTRPSPNRSSFKDNLFSSYECVTLPDFRQLNRRICAYAAFWKPAPGAYASHSA